MSVGGGAATLTFPHLNKDDEGLYTVRIWCKDGTVEHSAYLFVKGTLISLLHPVYNKGITHFSTNVFLYELIRYGLVNYLNDTL